MYPLITCISVLSLASLGVNADYEIDQCYWGPRQQLPSGEWRTGEAYVPCGEADDEVQSCCRVGHNCLEANACYAPDAGMVYTAGCTDFEYKSDRCPWKCDSDAYWVGHSYCNGTSNQWSCCDNQYGNPDNKELYPFNNRKTCWCPEEDAQIAFSAPSTISSIGRLDVARPTTIIYFQGYGPSTTQAGSSMPTSRSTTTADAESSSTSGASTSERSQSGSNPTDTGSPASDDAIPTSSSDPQPSSPTSSHSELSTPSKIGIGVGAGAGAIGLLAILWFVLTYLRKHNRKPPPPIEDQIRPKSFGSYAAMSEGAAPKSPDLQSPAWSGHKSELPADLSVVAPAPMSPSIHPSMSVEVEGSTPGPSGQTQPQARRQNIPSQSFFDANGVRQYVPYNPAAVGGHGRSASGQGAHEMPG